MCLNPQHIEVKTRGGCIGASVKHYWKDGVIVGRELTGNNTLNRSTSRREIVVPCGKCTECLKRRQLDLAVRAMREAEKRGSMVFCTLTYSNRYLPLQVTLRYADKDTGDIIDVKKEQLFRYKGYKVTPENALFIQEVKSALVALHAGSRARVICKPFLETETESYWYEITPSLNRRDIRLWLKRARMRYLRDFGKPLPDFSYLACGEYGPNTCRPHYHLCFFGLSKEIVDYLCSLWEYGFTNVKAVNSRNPDGTSGFQIAAQYVGKYVTKGKFECDSVKCGLSEKPRLMLSVGLGKDLPPVLVNYFRAYDLYGEYDIHSLKLSSTGKRLSSAQMLSIIDEVRKRSKIDFHGKSFPLPRGIILKLWYYKDESTGSLISSKFRRHYTHVIQGNSLADTCGKPVKVDPEVIWREDTQDIAEFVAGSTPDFETQEIFNERYFYEFYKQSIF